uniref:Transcriptional regulator n=1 Tax=Heterorhabditis bacteriophora TaxID=37862 RepID=A0A1I7WGQ4_HETBA
MKLMGVISVRKELKMVKINRNREELYKVNT